MNLKLTICPEQAPTARGLSENAWTYRPIGGFPQITNRPIYRHMVDKPLGYQGFYDVGVPCGP
jgi:hypothetical protein